jgi:hypothetical protein
MSDEAGDVSTEPDANQSQEMRGLRWLRLSIQPNVAAPDHTPRDGLMRIQDRCHSARPRGAFAARPRRRSGSEGLPTTRAIPAFLSLLLLPKLP